MPPALSSSDWLLTAAAALTDALVVGFVPTFGLLLAGRALGAARRPLLNSLTAFANTLLLVGAGLFVVASAGYGISRVAGGDEYEQYAMLNRLTGPYWAAYWGAVLGKGLLPQLLWRRRLRRSWQVSALLLPFLLVDFWLPVLYSLGHRDHLPASWAMLRPGWYELAALNLAYLVLYALLFAVARRLGLAASSA